MSDKNEIRAQLNSPGGWGEVGDASRHLRYPQLIVGRRGRRKCHCGCGTRCTHLGMANGVALTTGCEWYVRLWVRS